MTGLEDAAKKFIKRKRKYLHEDDDSHVYLISLASHENAARWKAMAEELAGSLEPLRDYADQQTHTMGAENTFRPLDQKARQSLSRFNEMKDSER